MPHRKKDDHHLAKLPVVLERIEQMKDINPVFLLEYKVFQPVN